ncbi:MAG: hypothetical protein HY817_01650 [Candidatus Abawacabacteria bacterium]|nr:hypothetical protein [Candidatus Abawacabacteria bacterium]
MSAPISVPSIETQNEVFLEVLTNKQLALAGKHLVGTVRRCLDTHLHGSHVDDIKSKLRELPPFDSTGQQPLTLEMVRLMMAGNEGFLPVLVPLVTHFTQQCPLGLTQITRTDRGTTTMRIALHSKVIREATDAQLFQITTNMNCGPADALVQTTYRGSPDGTLGDSGKVFDILYHVGIDRRQISDRTVAIQQTTVKQWELTFRT